MMTLGIETSCDETACAVLKDGRKILSNVVSSSLFKHKPFGGVVPEIASRHCLEQIDFVFKAALRGARVSKEDLDLVAVTRGPGLVGSLLVGLSFAKALAYELGIPFVGVNHLEAHLAANFIERPMPKEPFVGLVVSGGHTELTYHRNGSIHRLGSTVDDAVGEAYDKTAKILGLGYPGGPLIDRLAQKGNPNAFRFTQPKQAGRFDFSFSGIKTAVVHLVKNPPLTPTPAWPAGRLSQRERVKHVPSLSSLSPQRGERVRVRGKFLTDLSASFQETVVRWLVEKTIDACRAKKVRTVAVGGGVSANSRLRSLLPEEASLYKISVMFPPFPLTLDNGAMIARRGYELHQQGRRSDWKLSAHPNLPMGGRT